MVGCKDNQASSLAHIRTRLFMFIVHVNPHWSKEDDRPRCENEPQQSQRNWWAVFYIWVTYAAYFVPFFFLSFLLASVWVINALYLHLCHLLILQREDPSGADELEGPDTAKGLEVHVGVRGIDEPSFIYESSVLHNCVFTTSPSISCLHRLILVHLVYRFLGPQTNADPEGLT